MKNVKVDRRVILSAEKCNSTTAKCNSTILLGIIHKFDKVCSK